MAKIKDFDKQVSRELSKEIAEKLQPLAKKYGLQIKSGGGRFERDNFTMKLKISTISRNGEVNTKESQDFKRLAMLYGLKPTDLGRTFTYMGESYEITGMKPKSKKYPILAKRLSTGKSFKFPTAAVLNS